MCGGCITGFQACCNCDRPVLPICKRASGAAAFCPTVAVSARRQVDDNPPGSVAQQLFELLTCGFCAVERPGLWQPGSACKLEVLAIVCQVFLRDRLGSAVATLLGGVRVVAYAIQTDAQVCMALVAILRPAGLTWQCVFGAAVVAMPCHGRSVPGPGKVASRNAGARTGRKSNGRFWRFRPKQDAERKPQ